MERGQRLYDRWSDHEGLLRRLYDVVFLGQQSRLREQSVDALALSAGDTVLDLGCGTGLGFHRLRTRVGPTGTVVGLDYSPGMVERARERVREHDWENVHVLQGDAHSLPFGESFDAVYASMSVSAMPDPPAVAREAHRVLRPGGRVAVLDARPFQEPWTALNRVFVPLFRWLTDWEGDADVPGALRKTFGAVRVDGHVWDTIYVASARKDGA